MTSPDVTDSTPSKSSINRAGELLSAAYADEQPFPVGESELIGRWRELHAAPLAWLTMSVRRRTDLPVAYRLKRLPQIVAKLARAEKMALARMQDIGGCRLVVGHLREVETARERILRRSTPHYELLRESDYRDDGRQKTGYRALHLILRRDGFQIEAQLRSRRQHAWAEAVERAANRTGFRLKDGEGPDEIVRYFKLASDCLCELDHDRLPPRSSLVELRDLEGGLQPYLRDLPRRENEHFSIRTKAFATRENSWLLVYDWRTGERKRWMDCGTDPRQAARTYSKYEAEYPWREGYEVVLIGSDSEQTIEWTHAHYFGRSADDLDPHGVLRELRLP